MGTINKTNSFCRLGVLSILLFEGWWWVESSAEVRGEVFISGESLFRCEQFFWQTGVEVPFLRPMSTWVNATYLSVTD